jgi:hypothetical protein
MTLRTPGPRPSAAGTAAQPTVKGRASSLAETLIGSRGSPDAPFG